MLHLSDSMRMLYEMVHCSFLPKQDTMALELLEQTALKYEKEEKLRKLEHFRDYDLFDCFIGLLQFLAKDKLCKDDENLSPSLFLQKLSSLILAMTKQISCYISLLKAEADFHSIHHPFNFHVLRQLSSFYMQALS